MTSTLLLYSALLCTTVAAFRTGNAGVSRAPQIQDSLPGISWDATKAYPTADSIQRDYTRKWYLLLNWIKEQDGSHAAKLKQFNFTFNLVDGFSASMFDYLLNGEKNAENFHFFRNLAMLGYNRNKTAMVSLFRQYPVALQKQAVGRQVDSILQSTFAFEGKNLRPLLETTTIQMADRGHQPLWKSIQDSRFKLLVFGTSWCSPCKLNNIVIHETAKHWQPSQIQAYHLSLDENPAKWLADPNMKALGDTCWLVPGSWGSPLARQLSVKGVPHYFVTDENGWVLIDERHPAYLLHRIKELLQRQVVIDMLPVSLQPLVTFSFES